MKRILCLAVVLCLLCALSGCGVAATNPKTISIVCSVFPQYDFLREITKGADIELTLLLRPGQESHDFDPSSADIAAVHACDMFVYVGGESDHWIKKLLQSVDTADKTVLTLMDMVPPICAEHHHEEHDHDHTEETYDEHVWTSPKNAITIVGELTDALCAADPEQADVYRKNAAAYTAQLQELHADFTALTDHAVRNTIVVADRFPLLYFTTHYGLNHHAAFAGCAASVEPAGADLQALIETVKREHIPVVFQMELSAGNVAETVREQTGCEIHTFYACHNLSKLDFSNGESYLSLMRKNLITLKEALY